MYPPVMGKHRELLQNPILGFSGTPYAATVRDQVGIPFLLQNLSHNFGKFCGASMKYIAGVQMIYWTGEVAQW